MSSFLSLESRGYPGGSESTCNSGRASWILGLGRFPGGGHGNPLQYSCLENPVDTRAWWATVHGVTKSWTRLKPLSMHPRTQKPRETCLINAAWSMSLQIRQTQTGSERRLGLLKGHVTVLRFFHTVSHFTLTTTLWLAPCPRPRS